MQQQQLTPQQTAIVIVFVIVIFGGIVGFASYMAGRQNAELHDIPLSKFRQEHPTHLKVVGRAPQHGDSLESPPAGAQYVQFTSEAGKLGAWLIKPTGGGKHPAVLWAHGGFALGPQDLEVVRPFVNAGFVVMLPAWRGENTNPGNFEMCYGEADDAVAAVKYLQLMKDVDPSNIFVAGHSVGATLALLVAELTPGIKKAAACGAYPNMRFGGGYDNPPFTDDRYEESSRSPGDHVRDLSCPALLIFGDSESQYISQAQDMKQDAEKAGKQVSIKTIPGTDHFKALPSAVPLMIEFFRTN